MSISNNQINPTAFKDTYTQPDNVVTMPAYFENWIPYLGPELAWVVVGLRQISLQDIDAPLLLDAEKVAEWIPLEYEILKKALQDPRLDLFLEHGSDGLVRFRSTCPLTPVDFEDMIHKLSGNDRAALITFASRARAEQVIEDILDKKDTAKGEFDQIRVSDPDLILLDRILDEDLPPTVADFIRVWDIAEELMFFYIQPQERLTMTRYFLQYWLPKLGPARAWFVTILRHWCDPEMDARDTKNFVLVPGGSQGVASMLGVTSDDVMGWFPLMGQEPENEDQAILGKFVKMLCAIDDDAFDEWECLVTLSDPLRKADLEKYQEAVARLGETVIPL